MPTAEYIKAINLLNSKCYKNWRIAFEMCNDEEKKIIRKVMSGEDTVLSDKKEITLRKLENGKLMRHYYEYRHHPEYPNILVNSNGRIFQIKTKVSESDSEVTYIVAKRNRICYNESGNGRIAIFLNEKDLNKEVELITPNEKEYLIKFNMRGMDEKESYLKFYTSLNVVSLNVATQTRYAKSHFTKEEMQSIQPVREFLEDMEGKYELVEVEE